MSLFLPADDEPVGENENPAQSLSAGELEQLEMEAVIWTSAGLLSRSADRSPQSAGRAAGGTGCGLVPSWREAAFDEGARLDNGTGRHSWHQSPFAPHGRLFVLKQGSTAATLVFPVSASLLKERRNVRVRLAGTLPESGYARILSTDTIEVAIRQADAAP